MLICTVVVQMDKFLFYGVSEMANDKIARVSLTDQIVKYLQDKIISGAWKPGDKLPSENELADRLGVSRMSLRSALQRCNALGLTETRVGEGTFVRELNMRSYFSDLYSMNLLGDDPAEINDLRCVLQIASVRLAFEKGIDDKDIEELSKLYQEMEQAIEKKNIAAFHNVDTEFHRAVCGLCHNAPLYFIYDALEFIINDITRQNVEQSVKRASSFERVQHHHREIMESIKNRDLDRFITELMASRERSRQYYAQMKQNVDKA